MRPRRNPNRPLAINKTIKTIKRICAKFAEIAATPLNPKKPAINANTRNVRAQFNIIISLCIIAYSVNKPPTPPKVPVKRKELNRIIQVCRV